MAYKSKQGGFLKIIFLILIAIAVLSFTGIDIEEAVSTNLLQKNISYSWQTFKGAWNKYVYGPITNIGKRNTDDEINALEDLE